MNKRTVLKHRPKTWASKCSTCARLNIKRKIYDMLEIRLRREGLKHEWDHEHSSWFNHEQMWTQGALNHEYKIYVQYMAEVTDQKCYMSKQMIQNVSSSKIFNINVLSTHHHHKPMITNKKRSRPRAQYVVG